MKRRTSKINRQIKKAFGGDDFDALLIKGANTIAAGLPIFLDQIEKAYEEYEERLKMSERNIEISSRELNEAFRSVERLNASVNAMMDSLGQGFLFFDESGVFSPVYSRAVRELLGTEPADRTLPEVLGLGRDQADSFELWLTIAFSGSTALDFNELKKLLPEEFINPAGTVIGLDYRPMYVAGAGLSGVLMIATDLTGARAIESEMAAMRSEARKIRDIARSRNEFQKFVMDMQSFIGTCGGLDISSLSDSGRVTLMRQLHTYKGVAATFALEALARALHKAESALYSQGMPRAEIESILRSVATILQNEIDAARRIFGDDFMAQGQVVNVDTAKIGALKSLALAGDRDAIVAFIDTEILAVTLAAAMAPFVRELYRVAEMQGKPQPKVVWRGGDLQVLPGHYDDIFASFIHIARNIMDHAVAMPTARMIEGKPENGRVDIEAAVEGDMLLIRISDDGGGIVPDLIRERLAAAGRPARADEDDAAVIQHIFDAEFSTRDEADMLSGRGIGLNVVKEEVERLGGYVKVSSSIGKGTTMVMAVPFRKVGR